MIRFAYVDFSCRCTMTSLKHSNAGVTLEIEIHIDLTMAAMLTHKHALGSHAWNGKETVCKSICLIFSNHELSNEGGKSKAI